MNEKIVGKVLRIPVSEVGQFMPGLNFNREYGYADMLSLIENSTTEKFAGEFCTVEVGVIVRTKTTNKVFVHRRK